MSQNYTFYKYQGAGNDFVVIDNRSMLFDAQDSELIAKCCHRRFGIGADGLMLLGPKPGYDFEMIYFNANGKEGSMCGNGGRCIVAFARYLGLVQDYTRFWAIDGEHEAKVNAQGNYVELKMGKVSDIDRFSDSSYFIDTGSPHYISFVDKLHRVDVVGEGRSIRYNERYREKGTNVNFVEILGDCQLEVATYERGVEDETLACGTGVTAAAIAYFLQYNSASPEQQQINIRVKGGDLIVRFCYQEGVFSDVWLCGPAEQVFQGLIAF